MQGYNPKGHMRSLVGINLVLIFLFLLPSIPLLNSLITNFQSEVIKKESYV